MDTHFSLPKRATLFNIIGTIFFTIFGVNQVLVVTALPV